MRLNSFQQKARLSAASAIDQLRNILAKSVEKTVTHQLDLSELEDRILLSASPVAVMVESAPAFEFVEVASPLTGESASLFAPVQPASAESLDSDSVDSSDQVGPSSGDTLSQPTLLADLDEIDSSMLSESSVEQTATEVVFIDEGAKDFEQLVADLESQRDAGRAIDFFVLDSLQDGIDQIAETLESYSDLDAVHIVSHGTGGAVKLGATWLRIGSLDAYAGTIAGWGSAISTDGDILIYGCDLAANSRGELLVDSISALTGADVAASTDDTGSAIYGGDWELEYSVGTVETDVAFSSALQSEWDGLLNTFVVTTTADSGAGSLRQAILDANALNGTDTIHFNIADTDPGHFYYQDDLTGGSLSSVATTSVSDAMIGDFDPDYPYAQHSWFRIDLNSALPQLEITDALIIDGFSQPGATQNTLSVGNDASLRIELTSSGADGNRGLTVESGGAGSSIFGLVVNGFDFSGILTEPGADNVTVQGNFIGTDVTGTIGVANGDAGVHLRSSGNQVGGSDIIDRNVISGNDSRGVTTFTFGPITSGNVIENNYIGVDTTGVRALGNADAGVQIYNNDGLQLLDNVIAANTGDGVWLRNSTSVINTVIQGNLIGVGADGTTALGNTDNGIWVEEATVNTTIGGLLAGESNTIANNTMDGVSLSNGTGTSIRGNAIFNNGGLGIDLRGVNGVDSNDADDSDNGPNNLQNFPVLTSATISGTDLTVTGSLNSTASTSFDFDFFASTTADGSGHGEAERYIGSATGISTNGSGNLTLNELLSGVSVSLGEFITATATDQNGNTSEFALNITAVDPNTAPVISSNGGGATAIANVVENTMTVTTVTATDADLPGDTLTYSISGGADAAKFNIDSGSGVLTFGTAPDFESPTDAGADNVYDVQVRVSDGLGGVDTQDIAVTVTDIANLLTVDTVNDVLDGNTTSIEALNANKGADGFVSLREAIIAANNTTGSDTINLAAGTYTLSIAGTLEEMSATGDLDILDDLTITGAGAGSTIIDGGGLDRVIDVRSGVANISDVTVRGGNNGTGNGGGINVGASADLTLVDSWITGNNAFNGAGLHVVGVLTVDRVTVSGNTALNDGGGFSVAGGGSGLALTNVTVSGNSAVATGGAIRTNRLITVTNSTIAFNSASNAGGIGVAGPGNATLQNTILSNNTGGNANNALTSLGNNIDSDSTAGLGDPLDGVDPLLGALAANGGFTKTHALLPGSTAIDNGTLAGAPATDQRGIARDASPDIGAFEFVSGGLLAYESFSYAVGSLEGQSGGAGWATAWATTSGSSALVNATGLSDPTTLLAASGGTAEMSTSGTFTQNRDLTTTLGTDGTTAWFSFLVKPDGISSGGISLEIGDGVGAKDTVTVGTNDNDFLITRNGSIFGAAFINNVLVDAQTYFLAVQIDFAAGADTVTLYVDPTPGLSNPDSVLTTQLSTADLGTFTQVGMIGGFLGNNSNVDEIRVGASFADVAPTSAPNMPPTANAGGPYVINEGDSLNLVGSASSDPDTDPLTYVWDLDNDGNYGEAGEPTTETSTVSWATLQSFGIDDDGVYTIGLQVDDGNGGINTTTTTVTVNNTAPILSTTGSGTVSVGSSYTLNLSASDDGDDTISSWTINWGDGSIETFAGNPASVAHTYTAEGFTFNILASAIDEDGTFFQNELLVASSNTDSLLRYGTDGGFLQEFGILPDAETPDYPIDTIIGPDGNLYVSGWISSDVLRYDATTGAFIDEFVTAGSNGLDSAAGIGFGPDGHLYVASRLTSEVLRFDGSTGAFIDAFVTAGSGGLDEAEGLIFGPDGDLYVSDYQNNAVYKYDGTTGSFDTVFVSAGSGGLNKPENLTFGPDGNLYVADDIGSSVRRYDGTTGAFLDVFVAAGSGGLSFATGVGFGPDGNLYVGSWGTDSVLRYDGTSGAFIDAYIVSGSGGLGETDYFTFVPEHQVLVTAVPNTAPTITSDGGGPIAAVNVAENGTAVTTIIATDADLPAQILTYTITGGADSGEFFVNATTGVLTFAAAPDFETPTDADTDNIYEVQVTANDGNGGTDVQVISVTVTDAGDAPTNITLDNYVIPGGQSGAGVATVTVTDQDAGDLHIVTVDDVRFEVVAGQLKLKAGQSVDRTVEREISVTLTATDQQTNVYNKAIVLTVANDPVTAVDDAGTTDQDNVLTVPVGTGVLSNDSNNIPPPTAGATLNYDGAQDTDGDAAWQDSTAAAGFDFTLGTGVTRNNNPTSGLPGILSTYDFDGGVNSSAINGDSFTSIAGDPTDNDASFEIWFRPDVTNRKQLIFESGSGAGDGLSLRLRNSTLEFVTWNGATSAVTTYDVSTELGTGEFVQFIGTINIDAGGLDLKMHVNGAEVASDLNNLGITTWSDNTENFSLGSLDGTTGVLAPPTIDRFDGEMAMVRFYESELTASQITANHEAVTGTTTGLTAINLDTTTDSTQGLVTLNADGGFGYDPNGVFDSLRSGASTIDTFRYDASNGSGTATALVNITVTGVNDAPAANGFTTTVAENTATTTLVGTVIASDTDVGDTLSYAITAGNTNNAFAIDNSGNVTVNNSSELDYESVTQFVLTVKVTDDGVVPITTPTSVTINLSDVNDIAPVIGTAQSFNIAENIANSAVVGTVTATDADTTGEPRQDWTITGGDPAGVFAINASTGQITIADNSTIDFDTAPTSYTLSVTVSDGTNTSAVETVTINLSDVNDIAPVIGAAQSFNIAENIANSAVIGTVTATDADTTGEPRQDWMITSGDPAGAFAINASTGQITIADNSTIDFDTAPTSYALSVTVSDGTSTSAAETVTINLTDVNDTAPVITPGQSFNIVENVANTTVVGTVIATDADTGDSLTWSITGGNPGGTFAVNSATGQITVASNLNLDFETTPTYTLNVQIQDAGGLTDSAVVVVNVSNVNEAPTTTGLADVTVNEDSADVVVDLKTAFSDVETPAAALSYSIVGNSNPALFSGTPIVGGNLVLKFALNANGNAIIAVRATDPQGLFVTTAFNVVVAPVADVPTSSPDLYVVPGDQLTVSPAGGVLANDSDQDGDVLSALLVSGPANGSLVLLSNGGFTYTPDAEFIGIDSFAYEPFDGVLTGPQRTVVLNVTRVFAPPPPPTATASESSESSEAASTSESEAGETAEATVEAPISATTVVVSAPDVNTAEAETSPENTAVDEDTEEQRIGAYAATESDNDFFSDGSQRLELRDATSVSVKTLNAATPDRPSPESENRFRDSLRFDGEDLSYLVGTEFIRELEQVESEFEFDATVPEWATGTAVATTTGISVGYIVWMLRGGYVLASVLSTMPVWQNIDPLPVLAALEDADDDDDDSLETMIDRASDEADDSETSDADKAASDVERKDEIV